MVFILNPLTFQQHKCGRIVLQPKRHSCALIPLNIGGHQQTTCTTQWSITAEFRTIGGSWKIIRTAEYDFNLLRQLYRRLRRPSRMGRWVLGSSGPSTALLKLGVRCTYYFQDPPIVLNSAVTIAGFRARRSCHVVRCFRLHHPH
jgi:hypothetical protein